MARLAVVVLVAVPMLGHAECGWLLMMPRLYDANTDKRLPDRIALSAPLSEWSQGGAFDSAANCETKRALLLTIPVLAASRCLPATMVPVR
jgi:hypothetical protein